VEPRRIRVLHVVGSLRPGGVETWLLHLLHRIDRGRFAFDFLVHDAPPRQLEPELVALGSRIHRCPHVRRPARYARCFGRVLQEHGPFDVVHSHVHAFSGFVLGLAARHRVPLRIAHSHTTTERPAWLRAPLRACYEAGMRRAIGALATHGLACAEAPARDLFGATWRHDARWQVLRCGIDPALYEPRSGPASGRAALGLGPQTLVVGHVGNFHAVKNHPFLLRAFAALLELEASVALVCVGHGPALVDVRAELSRLGLDDRVLLLGARDDVPALMRDVFDVFVLPSLREGLPLALVEAQAAQLPCVISDAVTREADVPGARIVRLPVAGDAGPWARAILDLACGSRLARRAARSPVAGTAFDIAAGAERLAALYSGARC